MMDITATYNRGDFISFLSNQFLPDDLEIAHEIVDLNKKNALITGVVKLGVCPSLNLSVYEFAHSSRHDLRVSLSREAFTILERFDKDASNALAVFYNKDSETWRFSLITSEYSLGAKTGLFKPPPLFMALGKRLQTAHTRGDAFC